MTDYEAYVADPAEARPAPRLVRWRPAVATVAVLVLLAASGYLAFGGGEPQDPALEVPAGPEPPAG